MPLNLGHLRVFSAVAECGSVTLGAERLMISQPAASKQVKELERAVQTQLFEREGRGMRLTPAGEMLAGYARRLFALADEAEAAIADVASLRAGTLRIAASPLVGTYLLPQSLVHFRRRFPGITISLEIESGMMIARRVEENSVNLAITEVDVAGPAVEVRVLTHDELVTIVHSRHPLARKRSVAAGALQAEPFITRETASTTRVLAERALSEHGVTLNPVLSLASSEAIKQAVSAGLGMAIVSRLAVQADIRAGRLAVVRVTGMTIQRPIYLAHHHARRQSKAAIAFLCILKHAIRGTLPKLPKNLRSLTK